MSSSPPHYFGADDARIRLRWSPQWALMTREATEAVVQAAEVRAGMAVLDVASGSGEPALTMAERVLPDGHVVATDLLPEMLAVVEENARQRGLTNVVTQPADATHLPFPPQTFDAATCRLGHFPDWQPVLAEMRRVVRPGGRVAIMNWGSLDENPYFGVFRAPLAERGLMPSVRLGAEDPFRLAAPGAHTRALQTAGLREVWEERRTIQWAWPGSVEQAWEGCRELQPTLRALTDGLSAEQLDEVVGEVLAALCRYYDGEQVNFPAVIVVSAGVS